MVTAHCLQDPTEILIGLFANTESGVLHFVVLRKLIEF